ncbi:MAG: hypothetical protein LBD11_08025 [Candidatus Peribacteria bacterium]|nr:hypothetical protein [Candidatus Peribacteria bacterium]
MQTLLCPNIISLPLATESGNLGGANENLNIDHVKKIFEFCEVFFVG